LPRLLIDHPLEWQAEIGTAGSLASLRLRAFRAPPLGAHDVRIKVEAASLNFRDVVLAMGSIQGLEEEDSSTGRGRLGSDCAGIVIEIGSAVTRFQVGDAVMAMAPASLASTAITNEYCMVRKPACLSFADAAALPTVAVTALYALTRLGRLAKGDRVLIHSATGGVGLAAIQIAREIGAEIFATAGTELKREYLRSIGIAHVMDSRALDFADEIHRLTGGKGVDVVLNSLVGEAVERGMACLARYGRFVEIGKVDIYANNALPMGEFRRNLSFSAFDLDQLTMHRPDIICTVLQELADSIDAGRFAPLPVEAFAMADMEAAFRQMTLARQIGKIVLVNDGAKPALPQVQAIDCLLRGDGSYLITGGLGGFGLTVAEHLAEGRPGAIILMGRSAPNPQAAARIETIRQAGVPVEVMRGDVSDASDVARILADIAATLPPLRGVFHGAMVLDDQRLASIDAESMIGVMEPKATGAWHLHEATMGLPLDHFILFSSITSLLGNPLQANYAAANACLDALAHHRQAMGLCGLTINWGVLAGSGYVADRPDLQRFLDQQGYLSFTRRQAIEALDVAMTRSSPQVMAARIDWGQMASYSARSAASPRLAHLVPAASDAGGKAAVGSEILTALAAAPAEDRGTLIEAFLMRSLARILGMAADAVDAERSLDAFGLDSLLSVEFMVVLSGDLGFEMPVIALLDDMNIRKLGGLILADMAGREAVSPAPARPMPDFAPAPPPTIAIAEVTPPPAAPVATLNDRAWTPLQKGARAISRVGLAALGKVDVEGLDNLPEGPFILAVNHLSMADVPLALSVIPRRTVLLANAKLQGNWVLDQLVGRLGEAIYLPKAGDVGPALERALGVLRDGGIIALAPEGTRNRAGLGRAETGIAWLAMRSGLPVVPYAAWGQEQWRTRLKRVDRLALKVRIGAPIAPPSEAMGARDYADAVMAHIAALLPEQYRGAYATRVPAE
jgi:NADPH:quinone reductase-like Zn-dependent oxidoreductase/1-acyl-sn-glycerol-3-phosphate acyltransferase/NADP-dependent 3-hydroxy acid dehydrogenase YdfG/acyl carrier protein